jgi:predicted ATPase
MPRGVPVWRVRLFDGPVLEDSEGREIARFRSEKVQGLLAFLALRLDRRCPREAIADALWPDEPDSSVVANRLRVTLASLRRQLEPNGVTFGSVLDVSAPGTVRLREDAVWCDVEAFDRAIERGDLQEAAELARGPLLPGLYDEWVRDEQLRYEALREGLPSARRGSAVTHELSMPAVRHRLPHYLTRFIGREEERQRVVELLSLTRLVTLTGPGGIGKTRLSVEAVGDGSRPAVFVALDNVDDVAGVAEATLQALGASSRSGDEGETQLLALIQSRGPTLLVLDNAESAIEAVSELVPKLLAASPGLGILVTSRQRLELPGEVVFAVPPLVIPDPNIDLAGLLASPAVALFVDRARTSVPDFSVRERHVDDVAAICRRLEGMPLALELAGARVAVQSLAGIAGTLEENVVDLRSRQRGLSERHRSLRAAIQGSVEILAPDLRRLFARLSLFRGGWTSEAARVVCDEPEAESLLEELFVRSLIRIVETSEGEPRYAILEPLRAYAAEILPAEDAEIGIHQHAEYFLSLAAGADEDDVRTFTPLDAEEENLWFALENGRPSPAYGAALAGTLIYCFVRGRHRQALRLIDGSIGEVASFPDPHARFRWRYAAAQILPDVGRLDDTERIALAMRADAEATGDRAGEVYADAITSFVSDLRGDLEASLALSADALARARALGNRHLLETCLSHRSGTLHVYASTLGSRTAAGQAALVEAEALAREMRSLVPRHSRRLALAPLLVAGAIWQQERLTEAVEFFKEAQTMAVRLGTTTELMYAFVSEAVVAAGWSYFEHAAILYGAFGALQERIGYSLERAQSSRPPWIEALAEELRGHFSEEEYQRLIALGRSTLPAALATRRVPPPDSGNAEGVPLIDR